jgi:hypothetical protein
MSIISRFHVENPTRGIKPIDFVTISHVGRRVRRLAKAINTCIGRRWANSSHHHRLSWTISATLALTNTSGISAIVWWISYPYPSNHLSFQNLTCLPFPTDQPVPSIIWGHTLQDGLPQWRISSSRLNNWNPIFSPCIFSSQEPYPDFISFIRILYSSNA